MKVGNRINKSIMSGSDECHTRKINEGKVFGGVIFEQRLD